MGWAQLPFILLLLFSGVISAGLFGYAWPRRRRRGVPAFLALAVGTGWWSVMYALELTAPTLAWKMWVVRMEYIGIVAVCPAWALCALAHSNFAHLVTRRAAIGAFVFPAVVLAAVWTNSWHGLFWESVRLHEVVGFKTFVADFGPLFWAHTAYAYAAVFLGGIGLLQSTARSRTMFLGQRLTLLVAVGIPWLGSVMFLSGYSPWPYIDLTPFTFTISGMVLMQGILLFHLVEIVPLARDLVVEEMHDGVIVVDPRGYVLDANSAACSLLAPDARTVVGRGLLTMAPELASFKPALEAQRDDGMQLEIVRDGEARKIEVAMTPLADRRDRFLGHVLTVRDVTRQAQVEAALLHSERRFRTIADQSLAGLFLFEGGRMAYCNDRLVQIVGRSKEELLGASAEQMLSFIHENDRAFVADQIEFKNRGELGTTQYDFRFYHPDAQERWISLYSRPLEPDPAVPDAPGSILGMVVDITDRIEAEAARRAWEGQLLQAQKLESMGMLAGGVAHDFNNLLVAILGHADMARQGLSEGDPLGKDLDTICAAAEQAKRLCRQMLAYAGKGTFATERVELNSVIEEVVRLTTVTVSKKVAVTTVLDSKVPTVAADRAQLVQILLNLVMNAAEAVGDAPGTVEIETAARSLAEGEIDAAGATQSLPAGDYAVVTVRDSGPGMDAATRRRIFEPFFTTKFTGRGLGLAAVLGIVHAHGGALTIETAPRKGTTFRVFLPKNAGVLAEPAAAPTARLSSKTHHGTVLLVDDEPTARQTAQAMLERLGFTVEAASDGREAVTRFRRRPDEFACVLLDLTMPRMDGFEAFSALRALRPDVPIVLMSGYSREDVVRRFGDVVGWTFLQKPYLVADLQRRLEEVLFAA